MLAQRLGILRTSFTLADALLGIETEMMTLSACDEVRFTLADALLGIETIWAKPIGCSILVSLWLMPF